MCLKDPKGICMYVYTLPNKHIPGMLNCEYDTWNHGFSVHSLGFLGIETAFCLAPENIDTEKIAG